MVYYPGSFSPHEMPGVPKKPDAPPKPEKKAAPERMKTVKLPVEKKVEQPIPEARALTGARRIPEALELIQSLEKGGEMRRKISLPADKDKIENQQIDIIDATDEGRYDISFKLTEAQYEKISMDLSQLLQAHSDISSSSEPLWKGKYPVSKSFIEYGKGDDAYKLVESSDIKVDGLTIRVANRAKAEYDARVAIGLVNIQVPAKPGEKMDEQELSKEIFDIFEEVLDIRDALDEPGEEETREYARMRYAWHHKLNQPGQPPIAWEAEPELEKKLLRKEVFPGYRTIVEQGKHLEYEKEFGAYALTHSMSKSNMDRLPAILKHGFAATHERHRRGAIIYGISSGKDLSSGGADSVFTRIVSRESLKKANRKQLKEQWDNIHDHLKGPANRINFIFQPRVLDRTDWYAYDRDEYGSTEPGSFGGRKSPSELFSEMNNPGGYRETNEQMFRTGISSADIKAIACYSEEDRAAILDILKNSSIVEINGQPAEEFVKVSYSYDDLVKISRDEPITPPPKGFWRSFFTFSGN